MKTRLILLATLAALAFALAGCTTIRVDGDSLRTGSARFQRALDAVYPALVRIEVVTPVFREGREIRFQAGGSGAIISPDGYVITNHHVAGRATSIVCVLPNKEEIRAVRVGTDPLSDICVLRLTEKRSYPFAQFGDSTQLKVGDTVLAMGSPGSLSQSVTAGVVSNVDLILPAWAAGSFRLDGENVGSIVKWIAHDAAIFPGNSGGPLVNLRGEIVGINELGLGLSAAIPSQLAATVVNEIIQTQEPRRSWLGIIVQPLLKSSGRTEGALLSGIVPGSAAEEAGLKPGDIILAYNGKPVTARFGEDLPVFNRLVLETPPGSTVDVVVERAGEKKTIKLTTRLRTRARAEERELRDWGMAASDLTETVAKEMKRKNTDGVLVVSKRPGGPCAEAKPEIEEGDVIVQVAGKAVKNTDTLVAMTAEIVKDKKEPVPTLVAFERKNEQWLTLVRIGLKELPDRSPEARKAWMPAQVQVLSTDLAETLGLKGKTGVRLTDVFAGMSAEKAGLKVGDILTAIDKEPILASKPEDADVFPAMIRQRRAGDTVTLSVIRDGKELAVPVVLERSPKATREMKRYQDVDLGFSVRDISDDDRRAMKLDEQVTGALISDVEPGSHAAVASLFVSDVILSVNGVTTPDITALRKVMDDLRPKKPGRIVFFVKRGIYTAFVEAETPWLLKK